MSADWEHICWTPSPSTTWSAVRARIDSEAPAPEPTSDCPSEEEHFCAILMLGACPYCGQEA